MHGVLRFLDTELLPASSPEDYPKIIKSGIDEEGQHPKSPSITGPCGVVTLLYRIGRPQLFERLLDDAGMQEFEMRTHSPEAYVSDLYVIRRGFNVGFINSDGDFAQHGVRYRIEHEPESPYTIGKWTPLSTSDTGSAWSGSDTWVRAQSAAITKGIWWQKHWDFPKLTVTWTGMSDSEKEDLSAWQGERAAKIAEQCDIETKEYQEKMAKHGDRAYIIEQAETMQRYYKLRLACRADCGEQNPTLRCSKCKITRYCSPKCQQDDWKFHKTYCGTESPIPEQEVYTAK